MPFVEDVFITNPKRKFIFGLCSQTDTIKLRVIFFAGRVFPLFIS